MNGQKRFLLMTLLLVGVLILGSCTPAVQYKTTVTTSGQGKVVLDPLKATYQKGTSVQLTAEPDTGWKFKEWQGDLTGSANPATVVVNANLTINAVFTQENRAPVFNPIGNKDIAAGSELTFIIEAIDPDGDSLTYSAEGPLKSYFNPNTRTFTWIPTVGDIGSHDILFIASDGSMCDEVAITIQVTNAGNHAPTLNPVAGLVTTEGEMVSLQLTATDADGDLLTYSAENLPPNANFFESGLFYWTPGYFDSAEYIIEFTVSDGELTDSTSVTLTVHECILNVPDDYATIQGAINASEDGMTVVVAPGHYYERIDFASKDITVTSTTPDDPSVTIIDGGQQDKVVTFQYGESNLAKLEGFTIQNGSGEVGAIYILNASPVITKNHITNSSLHGIYIHGSSSPTIAENSITNIDGTAIYIHNAGTVNIHTNRLQDNSYTYLDYRGAGLHCVGSDLIFESNVVTENFSQSSGSALYLEDSTIKIEKNVITDNLSYSHGTVYFYNCTGVVANNTITTNHSEYEAGGIAVISEALDANELIIENNLIQGNQAPYAVYGSGGGIACGGKMTIRNNTITQNTAAFGGGIYVKGGSPLIRDNVIDGNIASKNCAGILVSNYETDPVIAGNLIKNHATYGIFVAYGGEVRTLDGALWEHANTPPSTEPTNTYQNNSPNDVYFAPSL